MKNRFIGLITKLCLLSILMFAWPCFAQEVTINSPSQRLLLNPYLDYLHDPSGQLTVDEVLSDEYVYSWQKAKKTTSSLGFSESAYWFYVDIVNTDATNLFRVLSIENPSLEYVDMYFIQNDQVTLSLKTGAKEAFTSRLLQHRHFIFPVQLEANQTARLLVRVKTAGAMLVPTYLSGQINFAQNEQAVLSLYGIVIGGILILVFYNLFSYLASGELRNILLAGFIGSLLLLICSVTGLGYQFIWHNSTVFNSISLAFFSWLSMLLGLSYIIEFLQVRQRYPRLLPYAIFYLLIMSAVYFINFYASYFWLAQTQLIFSVITLIIFMVLLSYMALKGRKAEKFFAVGLLVQYIGAIILIMELVGTIPYSVLANNALLISSGCAVLFMAFSLVLQLHAEQIQQATAYKRMLRNESRLRDIKEQSLKQQEALNEELEDRVNERTQALSEAMDQLSESNLLLKELSNSDSLTGLHNRRFFERQLKSNWDSLIDLEGPLSVMMVDVINLNHLNERFGYRVGDKAIQDIANIIRQVVSRSTDTLCRYRGQEFALLLPETSENQSIALAEKLKRQVNENAVGNEDNASIDICIGIETQYPHLGHNRQLMMENTEIALRHAKEGSEKKIVHFASTRRRQ